MKLNHALGRTASAHGATIHLPMARIRIGLGMHQIRHAGPMHKYGAGLLALFLVIGTLLTGTTAANAATNVTYPDAISNIKVERENGQDGPLNQWESAKITADWSVPNGAKAGDTFGMTLPAEFSRWGQGNFNIVDPETNEVVATCEVSDAGSPEVICTLTDVVDNQENIGGSFWMSVQVDKSTSEEHVEFEVGDDIVIADLPGEGGIVPEDMTAPEYPVKWGGETDTEGRFSWTIAVPAGYVQDGGFRISDQLDPTHENHHYTGDVRLIERPVEAGQLVGDWRVVDSSLYSVSWSQDMKSFDFEAHGVSDQNTYRLQYWTEADGVVLEGDVFGNQAVVGSTKTSSQHHVKSKGGGTGTGEEYTRFTVTKTVEGDGSTLVKDAVFTVEYSVKGSDAAPKSMTVPIGQPTKSDREPLGSTFIVKEIDLPDIDGVTWSEWILEGPGVTKLEDGTYEVTPESTAGVDLVLTNNAQVAPEVLGSILWTKVDPQGDTLLGSEWELTGPDGHAMTVVDNGQKDADAAAGALKVLDLPLGEYSLKETKAPEGYVLSENVLAVIISKEDQEVSFGAIQNTPVPVEPTPTEPTPSETPTEPTPTEPTPSETPTEPTPTEPTPTEPTPTEPTPTEPTPSETPTEPTPTEPTPTAPTPSETPTEPTPTEPTPTEPTPTAPTPTEPTPSETPTEPTPTAPTPSETPTEPTPTAPTPTEPTPSETPTESTPAEPTPSETPTEPTPTELTPTAPNPTEPPPTAPTPNETPRSPEEHLANTGTSTGFILGISALALASGIVLILFRKHRKHG